MAYGISTETPADNRGASTNGTVHAYTPLLGGASGDESSLHKPVPEGKATLLSSIGNLENTLIGTGALGFPLAMASVGLIPGIISCIFSGSVAAFGLYLLTRCAAQTPARRSSFFAVARLTYPSLAVFFDAAIAIKCFGVSISYLIIIKHLMPAVVKSLHYVISPGSSLPWWTTSGRFWITAVMVILVPLCFLRRLDSLRHTSYVALVSVAYLVVIVVVCHFHPPKGSAEPGEWHLVYFTHSFVSTFPVQVFAFTCAQNIFPIYNELASNTQERMNIVIGASIGGATLTYEIISIFGYLTFGTKVGANIIAMYPSTTLFIALGQFAISVLVLFSYPLQVHPCRNCLDKVFHASPPPPAKPVGSALDEEEDEEAVDDVVDEHGLSAAEMSTMKHSVLTGLVVFFGFIIAFFVDDLQMVMSFVGSTGSTTISFILPGLFYWKLFKDKPDHPRAMTIGAAALAGYGAFIFVFCLTYNIWAVVHPER